MPQAPTAAHSKRIGYFVTGAAGLALALIYLWLSTEYPFGRMDEPGARVWPTIVGCMVVLASLCVLWEGWRMSPSATFELPAGPGARRVALMIVLLVGYFAAMGQVGQLAASTMFCILFMRLVSPLSWPRVVVTSVVMSAALYLVFNVLLKIPMPAGRLFS